MEYKKIKKRQSSRGKIKSLNVQTTEIGINKSIKDTLQAKIIIPRLVWLISGLVSLIFFGLFIYSASGEHTGYAYSDELMATAYNLGLSRPPGQIFYTLLLHFILNLPLPVAIAMRGHILSALMQSLSLGLFVVSVWLLIEKLKQVKSSYADFNTGFKLSSLTVSVFSIVLLGSTPLIWIYGSLAEVPAFINLLIAILVYLSFKIMFSQVNDKYVYYLLTTFVILLVNWPQAIFLLPYIIITVKNNNKKIDSARAIKYSLLVLISLGISLGTFILLANSGNNLSWYVQPGISGIWNYLSSNNFNENVIWRLFGTHILDIIPAYIQNLLNYLGWFLIFLILIGTRFIFIISKKIFLMVLLLFGIGCITYPILLSWSADQLTQVIILRQYAMVWILFTIPLSVGLWILYIRLTKALLILSPKVKTIRYGLLITILLICIFKIYPLVNEINFSQLNTFTDIHKQILSSVSDNALLICKDDISCSSLLFDQQVLGMKKDVTIVPTQYLLAKKSLENKKLNGFNYKYNPYIIFDYVTWNINKKPVYMAGATQVLHDILGMPYGFTYYIPIGYVGELTRKLPMQLPNINTSSSKTMINSNFYPNDPMFNFQKDLVAQYHIFNALIYEKIGLRDLARNELNMGTNLLYDIQDSVDEKIESYRLGIESMDSLSSWVLGSHSQPLEEVIENTKKAIELKKLNNAYVGAIGVVNLSPTNIDARLLLANVYELRKQYDSALLEYRNVLVVDPENEVAKEKIKTLDSK